MGERRHPRSVSLGQQSTGVANSALFEAKPASLAHIGHITERLISQFRRVCSGARVPNLQTPPMNFELIPTHMYFLFSCL
jgi:hypothetical protein